MENSNNLLERFLRYVKTWTESNSEQADSGVFPSSPMQTEFAKTLAENIYEAGLKNIDFNELVTEIQDQLNINQEELKLYHLF